jgi:hypothetical protein
VGVNLCCASLNPLLFIELCLLEHPLIQSVGASFTLVGRGGMASKIEAATNAVAPGSTCTACVVASGADLNAIRAIFGPENRFGSKGTLFCTPGSALEKQAIIDLSSEVDSVEKISNEAREKAIAARTEARKLQSLPYQVRQGILRAMADALLSRKGELLAANKLDLAAAERDDVATTLKKRLNLTEAKLETLAEGLRQIADLPDPLGVVKSKRELADGMELSQITVPIGVLMIIFESRPDSMPQISALSIASGNGLLLKGGKEAVNSNAAIYEVLSDAIEVGSNGVIKRDIIALITSRGQVSFDRPSFYVIWMDACRRRRNCSRLRPSLFVLSSLTRSRICWRWMTSSISSSHEEAIVWYLTLKHIRKFRSWGMPMASVTST